MKRCHKTVLIFGQNLGYQNELEWSLAGYAELYDTSLGHIGHSWTRKEFDIDFRANKRIGDYNHVAFGASYRHMIFDVDEW